MSNNKEDDMLDCIEWLNSLKTRKSRVGIQYDIPGHYKRETRSGAINFYFRNIKNVQQ